VSDAKAEGGAASEAKGVGVNLLTLLAQASTPAFHIQLGRVLGDDGYGRYTTANGIVDLVSVFTLFGMDTVLARRVSVARAKGDREAVVDAVAQCLRVVLLSGLMASAFVVFGADRIAGMQGDPRLADPLRTLVFVPVAYHAASVFLVATQVHKVMKYDFWARGLLQPLVLLGLTTLALRLETGIVGACAAVVAGMTLTALLAAVFYGRVVSLPATLRRVVEAPWDADVLRAGAPLLAMSLVAALRGRVDGLLVNFHRGAADAGVFNACLPYAATLFQLRAAFYPGIAGDIPALIENGKTAALNALLKRQTRWVAILAMPFAAALVAFGGAILALHGPGFPRASTALGVLAIAYLFSALSLGSYALPLSGNARFNVYAALVSLALQLVVPNLLIPRYGLVGAAASFFIALVVSEVLCLTFSRWRTGAQGFSFALWKPAAASVGGALAGHAVQVALWGAEGHSLGRFVAGVVVAAVVYLVGLVMLGLDPEDRAVLASVVASVRGVFRKRGGS
jgi:O-antigen/teichoic acid export membrane protein